MDFVGMTSKVGGRIAYQVAALCFLIWFASSAFSAFSQSTLGEAAGACGFPTDGIFTGSATYELSADCDLSAIVERGSTWTIAANSDIIFEGNGYSLIGGSRGRGIAPFRDATFLTIVIDASSTLTLSNIVFDSIRMRVNGVLSTWNFTYSGARDHGIYVFGNADFNCTLFEDNIRKPGDGLGSALTLNSVNNDGAVRINNTIMRSNTGGRGVLVSLNEAPLTAEGCRTFSGNVPRHWHPLSNTAHISNNTTGLCTSEMGASRTGELQCQRPTPTKLPRSTPSQPKSTPIPTATHRHT